ncbi:MAG: glutathione binding-like protein, partial [Pseudomonadota bacterium]|nr:glutathione binding-like protein [Pseudomonadota bacterium]
LIKLEKRLEDREFLCAERFTVADICNTYALVLAGKVGLGDRVPDSLRDYRERMTARPAFMAANEREKSALKALQA